MAMSTQRIPPTMYHPAIMQTTISTHYQGKFASGLAHASDLARVCVIG